MTDTERACLHCEQTPSQIKRDQTICGIEGGYEHRELEAEWPRHRWADWTDKDLARSGIRPDAFERYRRTPVTHLQWAACVDTERGHVYPDKDDEWGNQADQCMACGHRRQPETSDPEHCETCNGSGSVAVGPWGSRPQKEKCPDCDGKWTRG